MCLTSSFFVKWKILTLKKLEKNSRGGTFVYFDIIRSEMMTLKKIRKFKILSPQLGGPQFLMACVKSSCCTKAVPNLVTFRQRLSELESIRLENKIVWAPRGSHLHGTCNTLVWHMCHFQWHMCHTRVHLPCKFGVSATVPSKVCPAHVVLLRVHAERHVFLYLFVVDTGTLETCSAGQYCREMC